MSRWRSGRHCIASTNWVRLRNLLNAHLPEERRVHGRRDEVSTALPPAFMQVPVIGMALAANYEAALQSPTRLR
jgi:hypothetical protein